MEARGTLIFFCGKMGAGKSTMSIEQARKCNAVLLAEDDWLSRLYPHRITDFDDYLKYSRQIRPLVRDLVQNVLRTGTSVVMDFPANTSSQREWFKSLCVEVGSAHEMIYLKASDELCLKHIARRRQQQPDRAAFDTKEVFLNVTEYFEEPEAQEELNVRTIAVHE